MSAEHATPAELLSRYVAGARVLRDALEGMDPDALRARPIAGKMSSLEVACHIVDSDQFMCDRMKRTIATQRPLLIGVESADYPEPLAYHERDPDVDLRLLEAQRAQMAADLVRLTADTWSRTAVHSENGLVTLLDLLAHATEHLEAHVDTVYAKREALGL